MTNEISLEAKPLTGSVGAYLPLSITIVNKSDLEPLWDHMVSKYHYLGYDNMIGPRIKYLVTYNGMPVAALSYNRASLKVGVRDSYLGYDENGKKVFLKHIVNNNRFLILPWIKIQNLASNLLSQTLKMLKNDWFRMYGVQPLVVETFVDCNLYKGTCYKAANWIYLGETKGFSKIGKAFVYHGNKKAVYIYLLNKDYQSIVPIPFHQPHDKCERVPNMMLNIPDWNPTILEDAGITVDEVANLGGMLDDYLSIYDGSYTHKGQRKNCEGFIKGILSNIERKSIEPIALEYFGEKGVRPMQIFFKASLMDEAKMLETYQSRLSSSIADTNGMINTDGCDFPKKGKASIGVHRQYCGILGKTDNCQSGVFVGYSSSKGYGLVDRSLYLPEKWFDDDHQKLRKDCEVPKELKFKTKVDMASEMINDVVASGKFPAKWIGCDSFFGRNKEFLASLPKGCFYFADIPENLLVFTHMPEVGIPTSTGRGKKCTKERALTNPVSVSSIAKDDSIKWQQVILGEGSKGPIIADVKILRVVDTEDITGKNYLPGNEQWLYIRRYSDGKTKFSLCNAPADIAMEELHKAAIMRWPIEQCFEECKSYLGMDHYEARSWPAWHKHMLLVMVAHLFIIEMRQAFKKNTNFDNATGKKAHSSIIIWKH